MRNKRDAEEKLLNPGDWDISFANELVKEEGIGLNETAWLILNFMRVYYPN